MKRVNDLLEELAAVEELTANDIDRIFSEHHARMSERNGEESSPHRWRIATLRNAYHRYTDDTYPPLAPGEIVVWKAGLRNRGVPSYGEPAIVVDVFDNSVEKMVEHRGQAISLDIIDIVIGTYDEDGDFLLVCTDSQRLERWDGEPA
jgi:hypothetical protein